MRLFAEERKAGTLELLLTAPVRESHVVLAKYLSSMAVVLAMIALTGAYAFVLGLFGSPEWGPIYSGYLGLALLSSTLVSLGLMISALTSNQVVAAIVTIGISFLLWTIDTLAAMMPDALERVLISVSLLARFTAVRDRRDVPVRFRILREQHAAGPVPGHARTRAPVSPPMEHESTGAGSDRSGSSAGRSQSRCCSSPGCGCRCKRA